MCHFTRSCPFSPFRGEPCPFHDQLEDDARVFARREPVYPLCDDDDVATERAVQRRAEARAERSQAGRAAGEFMGEVRAGLDQKSKCPSVTLKPAAPERLRGESGLEAWARMVARRRAGKES